MRSKRSLGDKAARARALEVLHEIRGNGFFLLGGRPVRARTSEGAVARTISLRSLDKFGEKPFLQKAETRVVAEKFFRMLLPGIMENLASTAARTPQKRRLARKMFGEGKLWLVMVRPDLFSQRREIGGFLRRSGFEIVLGKTFVFDRATLHRVYSHVWKNKKKYAPFPPLAVNLLCGPSRILVFRMTKDARILALKESLRESFAAPNLKKHGITGDGSKMDSVARNLDSIGYLQKELPRGANPVLIFNGVHVPEGEEVIKDAAALLSLSELKKLSRLLAT